MSVNRRAAIALVGGFALAAGGSRLAAQPAVSGVVFDSIAGSPLPGAVVQLVGRTDRTRTATTRTDASGRYTFDSIAPGPYVAGFLHPRLDSLYIAPPLREVDIPAAGAVKLGLFVPSRKALLRAHCGASAVRDSSALFLGRVLPSDDGAAQAGATVVVRWVEITIGKGMRRQLPTLEARTDNSGAFAICGLPPDARLLVQAYGVRDTSGLIEMEMPAAGLLLRDLHVGHAERVTVAATQGADTSIRLVSDSVVVLRGNGRLRGTVRSANSRPIAGATVRVRGGDTEATTDSSGRFTLGTLPTGTRALEASAIGFQPVRIPVDISAEETLPADVVLRPIDRMLDTMRVFAARDLSAPWRAAFDARRRMGLGRFLDEEAIEKRDPMTLADLLGNLPGVELRPRPGSSKVIIMLRAPDGSFCAPAYTIDGVPIEVSDMGIDAIVSGQRIRAVEIYRSGILTPFEFARSGACGTIVIWTGMRARSRTRE